jgi:DNA-binding transcriptional MerR regulator
MHISKAARKLGVHPSYLRTLEAKGRIPAPHRDLNGRIYSDVDLALLKALGVGQGPRRLRSLEELARTR